MIQVICGLVGEGKTLHAVWLIDELVRQGRTVATNIALTKEHPAHDKVFYIDDDEYPVYREAIQKRSGEIIEPGIAFYSHFPPGVTYVIDEADVYFDCSDYNTMARQLRMYFKQHRKRGDDIILIVQFPKNLWVRIRRLVNEWVWCRKDGSPSDPAGAKFFFSLLPWWLLRYRRTSFVDESMSPSTAIRSGTLTMSEAERIYGWYHTDQLIGDCAF